MTYQEKLRDPRWQKKRLMILDRDKWTCQNCDDTKSTLQIHHKYYERCDPWEYPDDALITLCEVCHRIESKGRGFLEKELLKALKKNFLRDDLRYLIDGFLNLELLHAPEVVAEVYEWALTNRDIQEELIQRYFDRFKKV